MYCRAVKAARDDLHCLSVPSVLANGLQPRIMGQAHPTGTVFFNDRPAIDAEISDMIKEVRNIETHMQPVVLELYQRFLADRGDEELWAFTVPGDEITANLVHANYMSSADISFCQTFDIETLSTQAGFEAKQVLHQALGVLYPADEFEAPA